MRPDAHARVRAELHQDAGQLLIATQHGAMERAAAELGVLVDQVGTRFGEPPHGRHVTVANRRRYVGDQQHRRSQVGVSPFRGHGIAMNARVQFTRDGALDKSDARDYHVVVCNVTRTTRRSP